MSEIAMVIKRSRQIETLLRTYYHAEGRGLHSLISSCEERLPHHLVSKLRFIASVRNKVVHDAHYRLDDKAGFMRACKQCESELTPRSHRTVRRFAWLIFWLMMGLGALFYMKHWPNIHF
ncbi:hypothetical protein VST7929_00125 [Vibrio stylophorae]|uniref:DUF4145 domain-containing protein n=1 Tax=Vibrio stylophorae TaxID=659351 RepID=A0ABN8DQ77_9VIBR|nr:DUF4145 domain-containing protein [Vibrio stylophorae]CAH0532309.1 hypothetical protein VST7929_00125 [Vibrio stylophorae]